MTNNPQAKEGKNHMLVASGVCDIIPTGGTEPTTTVDVFLYKQLNPFSERSPQLFGFLSFEKEEDVDEPTKVIDVPNLEEDNDLAF